MTTQETSALIGKLIEDLALSRAQFARILNTNESTVSRWIGGKSVPSDSDFSILRSLETLTELSKSKNQTARETLDAILGFAGKAPAASTVLKWGLLGSLFGAAGFAGVIGAALYVAMSQNGSNSGKNNER